MKLADVSMLTRSIGFHEGLPSFHAACLAKVLFLVVGDEELRVDLEAGRLFWV